MLPIVKTTRRGKGKKTKIPNGKFFIYISFTYQIIGMKLQVFYLSYGIPPVFLLEVYY